MPFMIVAEGDKFNLYRQGADGKQAGKCLSQSPDQPTAEVMAQRMTVIEQKMAQKFYKFPQGAVNYSPISANPSKEACSGCIFYNPSDYDWGPSCGIVQDWPAPIVPNGLCDRFERTPAPVPPEPQPVYIVDASGKALDPLAPLPQDEGYLRKAFDLLLTFTQKTLGLRAANEPLAVGFKLLDDNRWMAVWSNNFADRENEVFTYAAQDAYVDRVMTGQRSMPELWYYHIPGSKHGEADWIGRLGNFMVATGSFDDTPLAQAMKTHYKSAGPLGMSHGYFYPAWAKVDGTYHQFDTFELTTLPPEAAANAYTYFEGSKNMEITQAQKDAFLKAVNNPALAAPVIDGLAAYGKQLDAAGIASKMNAAPVPAPQPAAPVAPVDVQAGVDVGARGAINVFFAGQKAMMDTLGQMVNALGDIGTKMTTSEAAADTRFKALEAKLAFFDEVLGGASRASKAAQTVVPPAGLQGMMPAGATPQSIQGVQQPQPQMPGQQPQFVTEYGNFDMGIFNDFFAPNAGQPNPMNGVPAGAIPPTLPPGFGGAPAVQPQQGMAGFQMPQMPVMPQVPVQPVAPPPNTLPFPSVPAQI